MAFFKKRRIIGKVFGDTVQVINANLAKGQKVVVYNITDDVIRDVGTGRPIAKYEKTIGRGTVAAVKGNGAIIKLTSAPGETPRKVVAKSARKIRRPLYGGKMRRVANERGEPCFIKII